MFSLTLKVGHASSKKSYFTNPRRFFSRTGRGRVPKWELADISSPGQFPLDGVVAAAAAGYF